MSNNDPMGLDLWTEASRDHNAEAAVRKEAIAKTASDKIWPFLARARTAAEYRDKKALVAEHIAVIAEQSGLSPREVEALLDRDYDLLTQSRSPRIAARRTKRLRLVAGRTYQIVRVAADDDSDSDDSDDSSSSGGDSYYVQDKDSGKDVGGPYDSESAAQDAISGNDFGESSDDLTVSDGPGGSGSSDSDSDSSSSDDDSDDSDDDSGSDDSSDDSDSDSSDDDSDSDSDDDDKPAFLKDKESSRRTAVGYDDMHDTCAKCRKPVSVKTEDGRNWWVHDDGDSSHKADAMEMGGNSKYPNPRHSSRRTATRKVGTRVFVATARMAAPKTTTWTTPAKVAFVDRTGTLWTLAYDEQDDVVGDDQGIGPIGDGSDDGHGNLDASSGPTMTEWGQDFQSQDGEGPVTLPTPDAPAADPHPSEGGDIAQHEETETPWYDSGNTDPTAKTSAQMSTCMHCGRSIVNRGGKWIDPEAKGDDRVWRDTCDSHDTFDATHEPKTSRRVTAKKCANCANGNHTGTNGTPGCKGGSCTCPAPGCGKDKKEARAKVGGLTYRLALEEGQDPVIPMISMVPDGQGQPDKPVEHDTAPEPESPSSDGLDSYSRLVGRRPF